MPRAVWSGAISFGLVSIPVKLFTAVSSKTVRFNQIDRRTGSRVRQRLVSEADGSEVDRTDIVKGYQIRPGDYVLVDDEELEALDPKAEHTIDIEEFVDLADIDPSTSTAPTGCSRPGHRQALCPAGRDDGRVGQGGHRPVRHAFPPAARGDPLGRRAPHHVDHELGRRDGRARRAPRVRRARRPRGVRARAEAGRAAHRVAHGRVGARQVPGHPPRAGARPHRAQGQRRRRGAHHRRGADTGGEVVDLMAALEASVEGRRRPRAAIRRPPSSHGDEGLRPGGARQEGPGEEGPRQEDRRQEGTAKKKARKARLARKSA
jgi:hypothetical protein